MKHLGGLLWDMAVYACTTLLAVSVPLNAARGEWTWFWIDVAGVAVGGLAHVARGFALRLVAAEVVRLRGGAR